MCWMYFVIVKPAFSFEPLVVPVCLLFSCLLFSAAMNNLYRLFSHIHMKWFSQSLKGFWVEAKTILSFTFNSKLGQCCFFCGHATHKLIHLKIIMFNFLPECWGQMLFSLSALILYRNRWISVYVPHISVMCQRTAPVILFRGPKQARADVVTNWLTWIVAQWAGPDMSVCARTSAPDLTAVGGSQRGCKKWLAILPAFSKHSLRFFFFWLSVNIWMVFR